MNNHERSSVNLELLTVNKTLRATWPNCPRSILWMPLKRIVLVYFFFMDQVYSRYFIFFFFFTENNKNKNWKLFLVIVISGATGTNFKEWIDILNRQELKFPHIKIIYPTAPLQPYVPLNGMVTYWWSNSKSVKQIPTIKIQQIKIDKIKIDCYSSLVMCGLIVKIYL